MDTATLNDCALLRQEAIADLDENNLKPIEFLDYKKSIDKLKNILKIELPGSDVITLVLKAQAKVLEHLNDENFNCPVPWDKRTSLPSHPSMVTDAQKYAEFFKCSAGLKSVLDSLLGWSLFAKEELLCCCGGSLLKPRDVSFDVVLNHALRIDRVGNNSFLVIKQFVGVRCNNRRHLKNHYNFGRMSQVIDDLSIIFIAEAGFRLTLNGIDHRFISSQKADQFNLEEFSRRISAMIGEI